MKAIKVNDGVAIVELDPEKWYWLILKGDAEKCHDVASGIESPNGVISPPKVEEKP